MRGMGPGLDTDKFDDHVLHVTALVKPMVNRQIMTADLEAITFKSKLV